MNIRTKRWLRRGVVVLGIAIVGLNVLAYNHAHSMLQFSSGGQRTESPEGLGVLARLRVLFGGVTVPRPSTDLLPSKLADSTQVLSIPTDEGILLAAWYSHGGSGSPLVILFHGYSAEKTALVGEARALLELGASVLLVDFRGSGGSSENYTTIGVAEGRDVASVLAFAREHLSHPKVILFGQSMGAVAILRAIDRDGAKPDAVILEAVFDSMLSTVRNRFRSMGVPSFPGAELLVFWGGQQWGFDGFAHNPVEYAASVNCATLLMHGSEDPRATLAEAQCVFDAVSGPKIFMTFKGVGHESYLRAEPERWRASIRELLGSGGLPQEASSSGTAEGQR